ncbi:MAG TPA: hypothetical protein VKP69_05990, partial [Isosphaeraceae bacterium]|nr:hypothetical protein [Isosphaeraceae bacterium]
MEERPGYARPDWLTQHVVNPVVTALARVGVSVVGSRILRVRGRTSGAWRETPINLLTIDDKHYLVAPRGET